MAGPSDRSPQRVPPVRTCVGCRQRAAKSSLLRLVVAGNVIVPDPAARLPGRGVYLHPSRECLELAQRRRALVRALRVSGPLDTTGLETARDWA
ncbi:MAG: YlxR family protein [Actinobacteria bacterium]|nr:YlxR family protein [Actinomycetota bacterium]